ncbi:replication initiation protein, partial [Klebsiella oxytoca]|nr:replication initiation protein [Klebsiella oxytoca]
RRCTAGCQPPRTLSVLYFPFSETTPILKTMPADEAYWCTTERLQQLAIQNLYQLELALAPPS